MTILVGVLLSIGIVCALVAAVAFLRLATPLEKLHAGGFLAVASGAAIVLAGIATDGLTGRALKLVLIFVALLFTGAVSNHAVARALHIRGGDRR